MSLRFPRGLSRFLSDIFVLLIVSPRIAPPSLEGEFPDLPPKTASTSFSSASTRCRHTKTTFPRRELYLVTATGLSVRPLVRVSAAAFLQHSSYEFAIGQPSKVELVYHRLLLFKLLVFFFCGKKNTFLLQPTYGGRKPSSRRA